MNLKKKFFIYFFVLFFSFNNLYSIENKILLKINDEIITSIDLYNEANYLIALNKNLKNIEKKKIFEIAKKSLIKERIITNEILKYTKKLSIEDQYLNQFIESLYRKQNIDTYQTFIDYLKDYNVSISYIKKKISTEIMWNDLIVSKFSNKIKIDYENIKNDLANNFSSKSKQYLLSEILFNVPDNSKIEEKIQQIENDIENKGFKNTVLIHSISDSSLKNNGEIGWVDENSLNIKIKNTLNNLVKEDHTKPLIVPGGFLILKIDDIKIIDNKDFDLDKKIDETVKLKRNEQLNNYSNIYYNKIFKEYVINEKL